jgi:hypothetical protein
MKEKALAIWSKVQPLASKLYSWSPFGVGLALGYVFKPEIKLALDVVAKILKLLVGLL